MTRTIYRYEVPVDARQHTLSLSGPIVHVGLRRRLVVEVWAYATDQPPDARCFQVFGTGHSLPPAADRHVGTVFDDGFVWHLLEMAVELGVKAGTR